jgi:predicted acetyltransferase
LESDLEIKLIQVTEDEKSVLRQLLELYLYDFSEFDDNDVNAHGFYGYTYFDYYWTEETRHPFFIRVDEKLAGFVLINDYTYALEVGTARSMAEFFVMQKYRRKGIGKTIACQVFELFPGKWEVIQMGENAPSIQFWEGVVHEYTQGNFTKQAVQTEWWAGQALIFDNSQ